jgi:hypothetical protein
MSSKKKKKAVTKKQKKAASSSSTKKPSVNYNYDSKKESISQYNKRIEKERQAVRDFDGKSSSTNTKTSTSSSSVSSKAPVVNYNFDSRKETIAQYNARIERERQAFNDYTSKQQKETEQRIEEDKKIAPSTGPASFQALTKAQYYKDLPPDQQEAVRAIFEAIANNDQEMANRLTNAFEASSKLATPYFKQQLRLAKDELERGFVEISKEKEFKERQAKKRLLDLQQDVVSQKDYLSLEETAQLKDIERQYTQEVKSVRQDMAASGMTSSSVRAETEDILNQTTGEMRESTRRRFGFKKNELDTAFTREERDVQDEVNRLTEVAKSSQLDLFRKAESTIGTGNLPNLGLTPLGGIYGDIPENQTRDIISGVNNLIF